MRIRRENLPYCTFSDGGGLQMGPKTIIKLHFRAGKYTIKPFIRGRGDGYHMAIFPREMAREKVKYYS